MSEEQIQASKNQLRIDIGDFKDHLSEQEEFIVVCLTLHCYYPQATIDTKEFPEISYLIEKIDQDQELKEKIKRAVEFLKNRNQNKYGLKSGGIVAGAMDGASQNFKGSSGWEWFKKKVTKMSDKDQDSEEEQNSHKSKNKSKASSSNKNK